MSSLRSVAIRVHRMDAMVAFYSRAFGFVFEATAVGSLTCQFGRAHGLTLKLVPLRDETDFQRFPLHQLGFEVDDLDRVIEAATGLGGRAEGQASQTPTGQHAAVRDPDGNSIELHCIASA